MPPALSTFWTGYVIRNRGDHRTLDQESLRSWLVLLRLPGIGPKKLNPLLIEGAEPGLLLKKPPHQVAESIRKGLKELDRDAVEQDLKWLEGDDNYFIPVSSPDYPAQLLNTPDPPAGLFVHGNLEALSLPQIAMVGSRNPSAGGAQTAREFAHHFARSGLAVTSGLATGIDAASHEGALAANGTSIAVTGTGLDRVYPAKHRDLAHAVAHQGALVSEFPPGTPPRPAHFPRRNRIISGLSLGVLVVEAALQSGSLITARLAGEQCREVFAIPGSIHNPLARGCHKLIREGAKLVETSADVLEELKPALSALLFENRAASPNMHSEEPTPQPDNEYGELLKAMGFDPISTDSLAARTGLPTKEVSSMLLLLELDGHVSSTHGGLFSRTVKPS